MHGVAGPAGKHPMTEKEAWLAFLSSDDPRVIGGSWRTILASSVPYTSGFAQCAKTRRR